MLVLMWNLCHKPPASRKAKSKIDPLFLTHHLFWIGENGERGLTLTLNCQAFVPLKLTTETVLGTYEIVITRRKTVWILWKNTLLQYILSNLHIKLQCNILITNIVCLIWSKEKKLIVLENDIWACDYHFYVVKLHYCSNFRPPASRVNVLLARPWGYSCQIQGSSLLHCKVNSLQCFYL